MDIENELAAALRAQDPGADFTAAVAARLKRPAAAPVRPVRRWRLPAAMAASTLLAVFGAGMLRHQMQQQRMAEASQQLDLALAITSAQLNYVQQKLSFNDQVEDGI